MYFVIMVTIGIACCVVSWFFSILCLAKTDSNRRLWKSSFKHRPPSPPTHPRTTLIIPCNGVEPFLRENLTSFLRQDHPNYEVLFVVESANGPESQLIRNLMVENRCVQSRLVFAGQASQCGPKVHNLWVATGQLTEDTEVLAFADVDINASSDWLRRLVSGIDENSDAARTGFQWMIPTESSIPTLLISTINNSLASLLGSGQQGFVWGGSWAIGRRVFDFVRIRDAWMGKLNDDLIASRAIIDFGLDIEFEPSCVGATRVRFSTREMTEYVGRQLVIGRTCAPHVWSAALLALGVFQLAFWGGLIGGIWGISQGYLFGYASVGSTCSLYFMGLIRGILRDRLGRKSFPKWRTSRVARRFDLLAGPLVGLVVLAAMSVSMFKKTVVWRGVEFRVDKSGRVNVLHSDLKQFVTLSAQDESVGSISPGLRDESVSRKSA